MKKIISLLILSILISPKTIYAQETDDFTFERAYEDYIFIRDKYLSEHNEYSAARTKYLSAPTFRLREEAETQTFEMLVARDDLVRVYLTLLRNRVEELKSLTDSERSQIYTNIDSEVLWYQNHQSVYSLDDSLETLTQKSDEVANRYESTTSPLIYNTLFQISLAKSRTFRLSEEDLFSDIKIEVDRIKANGDKNTAVIERWFEDIDTRLKETKDIEDQAISLYSKNSQGGKYDKAYSSALQEINNSFILIGNVINYMEQIIREVMKADG